MSERSVDDSSGSSPSLNPDADWHYITNLYNEAKYSQERLQQVQDDLANSRFEVQKLSQDLLNCRSALDLERQEHSICKLFLQFKLQRCIDLESFSDSATRALGRAGQMLNSQQVDIIELRENGPSRIESRDPPEIARLLLDVEIAQTRLLKLEASLLQNDHGRQLIDALDENADLQLRLLRAECGIGTNNAEIRSSINSP